MPKMKMAFRRPLFIIGPPSILPKNNKKTPEFPKIDPYTFTSSSLQSNYTL